MPLSKEQMREYQRKRRLAEKGEGDVGEVVEKVVGDLPWPYNKEKPARWGDGVKVYLPLTPEEQRAVEVIAEIGEVRGPMRDTDRDGRKLRCALPECGKEYKTNLPLMRFCSRAHQLERLRQLTTMGSGVGRDVEVPKLGA